VRLLNLGILAHVDAGKTSLTERLLHAAGVTDEIGSVDDGNTRTDTMALERQRGITIRSAVVSFAVHDVTVNLVDTPGHPDFIAEVERVLGVLDGAVLVVSAVEGVQAQTRILMRTLRRLRIPTLIFANKIDRAGARDADLLREIGRTLTSAIVPMVAVTDLGTPHADVVAAADETALRDVLSRYDDALVADYVADESAVDAERLGEALAAQSRRALVHPVFFGSAITGAGTGPLLDGIRTLLPAAAGDPDGPVSGTVFKVDRGPAGEKLAYVRMFTGTVRARDRLPYGDGRADRITGVAVVDAGGVMPYPAAGAGRIAVLSGLADVRIGDAVGVPHGAVGAQFPPPTLETVVVPARPGDAGALHLALSRLAEQDPLIDLRQDDVRQELSVSLYGEVQKQVLQATLAADFGLDVTFRQTTTICVERVVGTGAAAEFIGRESNPFRGTVGLRVEPGTGVEFHLGVELGSMPLGYFTAVEETVRRTLRQGLAGWQVTDCRVTMTHSGYTPPPSTAGDFRLLTPLILMAALRQAGTAVLEPLHRFRLEAPVQTVGAVLPVLSRLRAVTTSVQDGVLVGDVPAAGVHELQQRLPGLTHGEGVLETAFDRYEAVRGVAPTRPRWDHNPLHREEYLRRIGLS
jgi:ribosomal protection tetracycline resistance protein